MSFVQKLDLKVGHFESFLRVKLSENFTEFDKILRNWNWVDLIHFTWG